MSHGNCFCYFPKWKSTSEEQLGCCNVLLPPITSPSLQVSQAAALTASSVSGACGPQEECADGSTGRETEEASYCVFIAFERVWKDEVGGKDLLLLLISKIFSYVLCFSMYLKR